MRAASAPGFVPARRDTGAEWGGRGMGSCREFRGTRARQESARIRAWDRGWVGARGRGALASTPRADPTAIISLISWVAPLGRRCSPSASLARGMAHDSRARAFARGVCAPLSRAQTSKPLGSWSVLWTRDGWADGSRAPARPPRRSGCFDSTASLCRTGADTTSSKNVRLLAHAQPESACSQHTTQPRFGVLSDGGGCCCCCHVKSSPASSRSSRCA